MVPAGVCVWSLVSGEMEMDSQIKSCSVASRGKVCVPVINCYCATDMMEVMRVELS